MERRDFLKTIPIAGLAAAGACSHNASGQVPASQMVKRKANIEMPNGAGGDLEFSKAEYERRYAGVRAGMEAAKLDALVVTGTREWHLGDLGNLKYLGTPLDWTRTYMVPSSSLMDLSRFVTNSWLIHQVTQF